MENARLRVAFIGGVECVERQLVALGDELGIDVQMHNGHMKGRDKDRLVALASRAHVVVLVTGVNSHGAVGIAKQAAAKTGAAVRIVKFCGSSKARALLTELAQARAA
jgi:hypothetical protein